MNAKNILINGENLNTILKHYNSLRILIQAVKGNYAVLGDWDESRTKDIEYNVEIKFLEPIK